MPNSYFSDLEKQELSHVTPWCEPNIMIFQPLESRAFPPLLILLFKVK